MFYFRISASEKMIFIYLVSKSTMFSFRKHRGGKFWNIALGKQTNTGKHNTHHGGGAAGDGELYRNYRHQWWEWKFIPLLVHDMIRTILLTKIIWFSPPKVRSDSNDNDQVAGLGWCCDTAWVVLPGVAWSAGLNAASHASSQYRGGLQFLHYILIIYIHVDNREIRHHWLSYWKDV